MTTPENSTRFIESIECGFRNLQITDLDEEAKERRRVEFDEIQKALTIEKIYSNSPHKHLPWYLRPVPWLPRHRPPMFCLAFRLDEDDVLPVATGLGVQITNVPNGEVSYWDTVYSLVDYINKQYCSDNPVGRRVWMSALPLTDYYLIRVCNNYLSFGVPRMHIAEVVDGIRSLLLPILKERGKDCVPEWYLDPDSVHQKDYRLPEVLRPRRNSS